MQLFKEKIKEQLAVSTDIRVIRVIDKIFNFAIGCEAEEIRLESEKKNMAVKFFADGELKNTLLLPKKIEPAVMAGMKEMAGLNYPTDNLAAAGKFKKECLGYKIIFSLNVHPVETGEKIIVNLKKEKFQLLGLGQLGLSGKSLALVKKVLAEKKGLVAVIGNFNSGRTATLYSFINYLKRPDLNIATIEREVVQDLPEINQSRLSPSDGFNSGAAVNAVRRQDADVVMIGEVNDRETAEAAFHLAAAGHFVLAGIYSQNVVTALTFLQDLGITLSLFSANARLSVTGRLAGRNCPYCLSKQKLGPEARRRLEEKISFKKLLPELKQDKIISERINDPADLIFYKSAGCPRCKNTGSAGKIGVFEVLEITPEVKEMIRTGHFSVIRNEVKKQGGYSLVEDALIKALSGLISLEEVLKLTD
jgi:type II secretory ATPase GspE/PulE/Tfp pilus assembly ATPase PilB-like protein